MVVPIRLLDGHRLQHGCANALECSWSWPHREFGLSEILCITFGNGYSSCSKAEVSPASEQVIESGLLLQLQDEGIEKVPVNFA